MTNREVRAPSKSESRWYGMSINRGYLVCALAAVFGAHLQAATLLCSVGIGVGVATSTACVAQGPGAITYNTLFPWYNLSSDQTLGPDSGPTYSDAANPNNPHVITGSPTSGSLGTNPWTGSAGATTVSATLGPLYMGSQVTNDLTGHADYQLELMGNAGAVWDGTEWDVTPPVGALEFAGHFGAPNMTTPVAWQYGDTLLVDQGEGPIDLGFSAPVSAVAFQVSSMSDPTFIATVTAWNAAGMELGSYIINTANFTGSQALGGVCGGLGNANFRDAPGTPCTDTPAPWIAISDLMLGQPGAQISTIQISVNDNNGFAIDTLELAAAELSVPEPSAPLLSGVGLGVLWYLRRRKFSQSR